MTFKIPPLIAALAAAGLVSMQVNQKASFAEPTPRNVPKRRTTPLNYEQQKAAYDAAEAKRLMRQSKRLADAKKQQGDLL